MRILVMGGTRFVGRHIVAAALARGHHVSLFHRWAPSTAPEAGVEHILGDRMGDLSGLLDGDWDATIDVTAFTGTDVERLAGTISGRGGQYVLISSTAVYAHPQLPGYLESAPLVDLATASSETASYGGHKVLAERAARRTQADALVIRPTYVVGPYDYTGRLAWWIRRIRDGGEVLAPGPASAPIQLIDVRDLAKWLVDLVQRRIGGTFHAVGPRTPLTFEDMLGQIRSVTEPKWLRLNWVPRRFLLDSGQDGHSLPLWTGGYREGLPQAADPSRAYESGLDPRPFTQTLQELVDIERDASTTTDARTGLARDREALLLEAWRADSGG